MRSYPVKKDDISIILCGAAGQGVQTVEQMLTHLFSVTGYNLFSTKEYMSRVRGGSNSTEIRIASAQVRAYVDRIDILFPLSREALEHVSHRISDDTIIIGERENLLAEGDTRHMVDIPFTKIAGEIGDRNVVLEIRECAGLAQQAVAALTQECSNVTRLLDDVRGQYGNAARTVMREIGLPDLEVGILERAYERLLRERRRGEAQEHQQAETSEHRQSFPRIHFLKPLYLESANGCNARISVM